jgi:ABC-type glycerol-3-phosphate transport system permease component
VSRRHAWNATLPRHILDTAHADGARGWTLFAQVVVSQLQPLHFIVAMVCTVAALRSFDYLVIMAGRGHAPGDGGDPGARGYVCMERLLLGAGVGAVGRRASAHRGLQTLRAMGQTFWQPVCAGSLLVALPPGVFFVLQRQLMARLTTGTRTAAQGRQ